MLKDDNNEKIEVQPKGAPQSEYSIYLCLSARVRSLSNNQDDLLTHSPSPPDRAAMDGSVRLEPICPVGTYGTEARSL